jgi:hypothetical protein
MGNRLIDYVYLLCYADPANGRQAWLHTGRKRACQGHAFDPDMHQERASSWGRDAIPQRDFISPEAQKPVVYILPR